MCDVTAFNDYLSRLEDYLEFVNTDVDRLMTYEPELYAAYGSYKGLTLENIRDWYVDAEDDFITVGTPEDYIDLKYEGSYGKNDLWELADREIQTGYIFENAGYWFAVN